MEAIIVLVAVVIALVVGIRWAIGFVRTVTHKTGHHFLSVPFWLLLASLVLATYVGFTATKEYYAAVIVFGAIGIAGVLNIRKIGIPNGIIFTVLQCIAIYCSVIVLILYAIFKSAKESSSNN